MAGSGFAKEPEKLRLKSGGGHDINSCIRIVESISRDFMGTSRRG